MKKFPTLNLKKLPKIKGKNFKQIIKLICGEFIGEGVYRDVYVLKQDPRFVVKIEPDPSKAQFANVTEWRNYIEWHDHYVVSGGLAPCESISEDGQVLIQCRVNWKDKRRKDYPTHIPGIFTDLKLKNFGWIGNQFVCCDYSFFRHAPLKFRYARWWGSLKTKN